ncbi:hypothetical protein M433DRAFT_203471 [Acidomyces richmondensis BFW]|nr:hypothetical protein M433DRAFT_203471 [Acidomyces richmondensis BFW]
MFSTHLVELPKMSPNVWYLCLSSFFPPVTGMRGGGRETWLGKGEVYKHNFEGEKKRYRVQLSRIRSTNFGQTKSN